MIRGDGRGVVQTISYRGVEVPGGASDRGNGCASALGASWLSWSSLTEIEGDFPRSGTRQARVANDT